MPRALTAGPDGNVWFVTEEPAAVGRISPSGSVTMFPLSGESQPSAITTAVVLHPLLRVPARRNDDGARRPPWVASGTGHCPSYCGGGSEQSYIFGSSSIGRFALPSVTVAIGPSLGPLRHNQTSIVVGCGDHAACSGTLRLRALVKPPGKGFSARLISKVTYSLGASEIQKVALRVPHSRWSGTAKHF